MKHYDYSFIQKCEMCGTEFESYGRKTCGSICRAGLGRRTKREIYGDNILKQCAAAAHNTHNLRKKIKIENATLLSENEVHDLLISEKFYYKKYFGKARNRTLINDNVDLYKSLIYHTDNKFKDKKVRLNLTCRLILVAEFNFKIEKILCKCGSRILYNPETQQISNTIYCNKCMPGPNTLEYFIRKYGDVNGKIKYHEFIEKMKDRIYSQNSFNNVSKISTTFFDSVVSNINMQHLKEICLYNKEEKTILLKPSEIFILNRYDIKREAFFIDFTCNNVIVEYNGIYWHSKTEKYDNIRFDILKNRGYSVLYVDEQEYMDNPTITIEKTVEFILNNFNKDIICK